MLIKPRFILKIKRIQTCYEMLSCIPSHGESGYFNDARGTFQPSTTLIDNITHLPRKSRNGWQNEKQNPYFYPSKTRFCTKINRHLIFSHHLTLGSNQQLARWTSVPSSKNKKTTRSKSVVIQYPNLGILYFQSIGSLPKPPAAQSDNLSNRESHLHTRT